MAMRGRPLVVTWKDSLADLKDRLDKERDPRRRARLQAFVMLREGKRISDVSDAVGADYRTIQRWVSWYRAGGLDAVLKRTPGHAAPGRRSKLSADQTRALLHEYQEGKFRTIRDAVEWTSNTYGVDFTYTGMHAHLRRAERRAPH
jgi:transposase